MKITSLKAIVAKMITAGVLAGAFVMAAPKQAQAQRFVVGVQAGYPYYGPAYVRHDDFRRHEEWIRAREFDHYHYHAPYRYR
jgi:hypothetical protein